jgi:hypothetical protein
MSATTTSTFMIALDESTGAWYLYYTDRTTGGTYQIGRQGMEYSAAAFELAAVAGPAHLERVACHQCDRDVPRHSTERVGVPRYCRACLHAGERAAGRDAATGNAARDEALLERTTTGDQPPY